jgi:hypothetical protein
MTVSNQKSNYIGRKDIYFFNMHEQNTKKFVRIHFLFRFDDGALP